MIIAAKKMTPSGQVEAGILPIFLADEKGQALVEFAIVIPIILLAFCTLIQFCLIARTTHLGHYAAFMAARTYAVRSSWDKHAREAAKKAAALAYAPLSKPTRVEADLLEGSVGGVFPGIGGIQGKYLENFWEGLLTAYSVRLNPAVGGGSLGVVTAGEPRQVNIELNCAYPLAVPGLSGLWPRGGMRRDISPLAEGLKSQGIYPVINITTKCALGEERWSGKVRKHWDTKRRGEE